MRKGWEEKRLGEVCIKITDGSHNPPKGVDTSDFMMLSSKNILDDDINFNQPRYLSKSDFLIENKRTQIAPGDVLLTIVGTIGRVAVVPDEFPLCTLQRSVAVLKPLRNKLFSRFLMYSLQNDLENLNTESRGVAQKGLYLNQIFDLPLSLPPLPEQKRIVAILDEAFAGISRAKEIAEKNLANAKEVFESYLHRS